ncbi:sugar-binding transcriptional regulator [Solirhodobacter olei]|uniref:sugar-binding transcriptional regulator n=1 Tax=Solirhodobacter olei TaxID=2493082 RepID=UPI000FD6FB6E|nr:sugar-binding transcriptional regulator [Solirhodobacter olei]
MSRGNDTDAPLDEAARAGWLYYVAGMTQDQIARDMGISRQRAQRLVSRAVAEQLIHVRLEHPIVACLELERELCRRFDLLSCRVAPSLGPGTDPLRAIAPVAAAEMERVLRSTQPLVIALGTGRALRATVEELAPVSAEQHRLVSLIGNIAPDGSASFFDVIMRIADKVHAPHYPMPVPVLAETAEQNALFHDLAPIRRVVELARSANVCFVGVGQLSDDAPLHQDGFVSRDELSEMRRMGAIGEIAGWVYDSQGRYLDLAMNQRVGGVRVDPTRADRIIAIAGGRPKYAALQAALKGRIINGLITDEDSARAVLAAQQR